MSLHMLGSGNELQSIGDLYGIYKIALSKLICIFQSRYEKSSTSFCATASELQFRILASRFQKLHCIPYIIRIMEWSHIFCFTINGEDNYYCRNLFNQYFYIELSDQIVCYKLIRLNGQIIFTIALFSSLQELNVNTQKICFSCRNLQETLHTYKALDVLSI